MSQNTSESDITHFQLANKTTANKRGRVGSRGINHSGQWQPWTMAEGIFPSIFHPEDAFMGCGIVGAMRGQRGGRVDVYMHI